MDRIWLRGERSGEMGEEPEEEIWCDAEGLSRVKGKFLAWEAERR